MENSVEEWGGNQKDWKVCSCCSEWKEKSKRAEARVLVLELESERRRIELDALEAKFKELEAQKRKLEQEIIELRRTGKLGSCIEGGVVDLTMEDDEEEGGKVAQLMIKNEVLECEKKAEDKAEMWKQKFKELEMRDLQLDRGAYQQVEQDFRGKLTDCLGAACKTPAPGTPYGNIRCDNAAAFIEGKRSFCMEPEGGCGKQVRKHLSFEEEKSPNKKMAPMTPSSAKPTYPGIINIHDDSDDESNTRGISVVTPDGEGNEKVCTGRKAKIPDNSLDKASFDQCCDEDNDACKDSAPCITLKRKRAANVVTSDTDEEDHVPIRELKRKCLQEIPDKAGSEVKNCSMAAACSPSDNVTGTKTPSRRRLVRLGQCKGIENIESSFSRKTCKSKCERGISTTEGVEDGKSEENSSESEGESLNGFLVGSSDVSNGNDAVCQSEDEHASSQSEDEHASSQLEDDSDDNMDFKEILSRLQRSKGHKFKWEFEADMLADFGKSPELCMKAVCALYRQQTSDEKSGKGTFHYNNRGFSKFDALRGTQLAEFLTGGDHIGDVKKSVQELQEYDSKGVEVCRTFATRYSKQLFEIYKNKEDPLFLPD